MAAVLLLEVLAHVDARGPDEHVVPRGARRRRGARVAELVVRREEDLPLRAGVVGPEVVLRGAEFLESGALTRPMDPERGGHISTYIPSHRVEFLQCSQFLHMIYKVLANSGKCHY